MLWVGVYLGAGVVFNSQIEWLLGEMSRRLRQHGRHGSGALAGVLYRLQMVERRRFYRMLRMARISVDLYALIQAGAAPVIVDVRSTTARELEPRWILRAAHVPLPDVARL